MINLEQEKHFKKRAKIYSKLFKEALKKNPEPRFVVWDEFVYYKDKNGKKLKMIDHFVLSKLAEYGTIEEYPTIKELAELFGVSELTILRSMKKLRDAGHIYSLTEYKLRTEGINRNKKHIVFNKYNKRCAYCGKELEPFMDFEVDHIIPYSECGNDNIENLNPSCKHCNGSKHNYSLEEWREFLQKKENKQIIFYFEKCEGN